MHESSCDLFPNGRGDFRPFLDFRGGVKSVLGKFRELKAIVGSQQIAERQQHQHRYRLCTSKEEQVGMGADFWDISESWSRPYLASVKGSRQTTLTKTYFHSDWLLDKAGNLPANMVDRLVIVNEDTDVIWSVDFSMMARLYDRRKLPSSSGFIDLEYLTKLRQPGEKIEVIQLDIQT